MKIFIKEINAQLYKFADEAMRNEDRPRENERMAGVSARKVAEWKKIINQFIEVQSELMTLYENKANQS